MIGIAAWRDFFTACAGASAALAGLIFVALSVNIARILEFEHLPARAAAAMGALMLILTVSLAVLAPQPPAWLGGEVLGLTLLAWLLQIGSACDSGAAARKYGRPARRTRLGDRLRQVQMAPYAIGGVLLIAGADAGLAWIALGAVAVFILSVVNAWVLLVEILR
ncbi:MAG: hypothetical protein WDM85_19135 [Caulobacteraceae bacterium]